MTYTNAGRVLDIVADFGNHNPKAFEPKHAKLSHRYHPEQKLAIPSDWAFPGPVLQKDPNSGDNTINEGVHPCSVVLPRLHCLI